MAKIGRPKGIYTKRIPVSDEMLLASGRLTPNDLDTLHTTSPDENFRMYYAEVVPQARATPKKILSQLIRDIGNEVIDPALKWTRVETVIRSLYVKAMKGDVAAAREILDRGWGRVPLPVELDSSSEVRQLLQEKGIAWTQAVRDPVLNLLFAQIGMLEEPLKTEAEIAEMKSNGP